MIKVTTDNLIDTVDTLKKIMRNGEVSFTFLKKNGETRTARGTLNADIIKEKNATPKGIGYEFDEDTVTRYYDVNSEGWRSFSNSNLVSIDD